MVPPPASRPAMASFIDDALATVPIGLTMRVSVSKATTAI